MNKYRKSTNFVYLAILAMEGMSLSWINSVYAIFLASFGLNGFQINSINAVFMVTTGLIDPLTGKFADRYGQKFTFILSCLFWSLGTLVYGFSTTIVGFLFAEITAGLGHALRTDALESWHKNAGGDTSARGEAKSLRRILAIPAAILGNIVAASWGLEWPWIIEAGAVLLMALVAIMLFLVFQNKQQEVSSFKTKPIGIREALKESLANPVLLRACLIAFVVNFAVQPLNMFWALILSQMTGDISWLGFIWIPISLALSLGSFLGGRIEFPRLSHLGYSVAAIGSFMVLTGISVFIGNPWLVLILFVIHEIPRAVLDEYMFNYSNEQMTDESRSTFNSVRGGIAKFGAVFGLLCSGVVTIVLPLGATWIIAGLLMLGLYVWLSKLEE